MKIQAKIVRALTPLLAAAIVAAGCGILPGQGMPGGSEAAETQAEADAGGQTENGKTESVDAAAGQTEKAKSEAESEAAGQTEGAKTETADVAAGQTKKAKSEAETAAAGQAGAAKSEAEIAAGGQAGAAKSEAEIAAGGQTGAAESETETVAARQTGAAEGVSAGTEEQDGAALTEGEKALLEARLPVPGLPSDFDRSMVPAYAGTVWADINEDIPFFDEKEMSAARVMAEFLSQESADSEKTSDSSNASGRKKTSDSSNASGSRDSDSSKAETGSGDAEQQEYTYQIYGELDRLGRCTGACALVGPETLPTEERGNIGMIKPTGWHTVKYDGIDGNYLYNRCHLIGFQLTGQDANEKNLITGTRFLNVEGMLPYEDSVLAYVEGTGNHVLYRVTPVFREDNLLADGVLMEARSVEDPLVQFCAFCYNVQPGITIDYASGESSGPAFTGGDDSGNGSNDSGNGSDGSGNGGNDSRNGSNDSRNGSDDSGNGSNDSGNGSDGSLSRSVQNAEAQSEAEISGENDAQGADAREWKFIVNVSSGKFHRPDCQSVEKMSRKNKRGFNGTREELIEMGYEPCKNCHP